MAVSAKSGAPSSKGDAVKGEKPLPFFSLLRKVHGHVTALSAYPSFLCRWLCLQSVITLSKLAFPLFILCFGQLLRDLYDDNDDSAPPFSELPAALFVGAAVTGLISLGGLVAPSLRDILVNTLKEDFKSLQAVAVVRKVFLLPHDTHISTPTGEFPQLLMKVFQLDGIFTNLYVTVFPALMELTLAGLVFLIMFSGLTGSLGFSSACIYVPITLVLILCIYGSLRYRVAKQRSGENKAAMKAVMSEWGNLLAVVQSYEQAHFFGNVEYEINKAKTSFENIVRDVKKFVRVDWASVGVHVLAVVSVVSLGAVVLLHFAYGSEDLSERLYELAALFKYLLGFPALLMTFGTAVAALRAAASEYEVLDEFLSRPSDTADIPGATELRLEPNVAPEIEFRHVSFAYPRPPSNASAEAADGDENLILNDVSFTILPGETAGFVGSSGCGKSTLLRLILRFYAPRSGEILVNGQNIRGVTGESLRRAFSIVTQNAKLFNGSLRENVDYGKMGSSDTDIVRACRQAELNLSDLAEEGEAADIPSTGPETLPRSSIDEAELRALDKRCGETGAKLSGGQQQRVALARALLENSRVFLLDEPTAALDNKVARDLMKTMEHIQQNGGGSGKKTLIQITHRLEELKQADQIFYLKDGKIVERGTFAGLIQQQGEFAEQVKAKEAQE